VAHLTCRASVLSRWRYVYRQRVMVLSNKRATNPSLAGQSSATMNKDGSSTKRQHLTCAMAEAHIMRCEELQLGVNHLPGGGQAAKASNKISPSLHCGMPAARQAPAAPCGVCGAQGHLSLQRGQTALSVETSAQHRRRLPDSSLGPSHMHDGSVQSTPSYRALML
jgi:hypothetical protein